MNLNTLDRNKEAALVIAYKYFYRYVSVEEVESEIKRYGLLDMSHNEMIEFKNGLRLERQAMLEYFDRPASWKGAQAVLGETQHSEWESRSLRAVDDLVSLCTLIDLTLESETENKRENVLTAIHSRLKAGIKAAKLEMATATRWYK